MLECGISSSTVTADDVGKDAAGGLESWRGRGINDHADVAIVRLAARPPGAIEVEDGGSASLPNFFPNTRA